RFLASHYREQGLISAGTTALPTLLDDQTCCDFSHMSASPGRCSALTPASIYQKLSLAKDNYA
ncbi:MAG: hypothetical protein AAF212_10705, partial [Verrucomicrobiota bacterium]